MKLHVFNPEHDIALAHGSPYFTAPKAGKELRRDCGFLPVIWAAEDDVVLVDDVEIACQAYRQMMIDSLGHRCSKERENILESYDSNSFDCKAGADGYEDMWLRRFVGLSQLRSLPITEVCPWGWDAALAHQLWRAGVGESLLPSKEALENVRKLSSRRFSASILPEIVSVSPSELVGKALDVSSQEELEEEILKGSGWMLKAPWSSSGRGLLHVEDQLTGHQAGWVKNVLGQQGALMMEPYYNKVRDFGMEFWADGETVVYRGLSVFDTSNGAYTGNVLATEKEKLAMLAPYATHKLLVTVQKAICKCLAPHLRNRYAGPLGVDMMIVKADSGLLLHPMVEINLRRTMGHVALDLFGRLFPFMGQMCIDYARGGYRLCVESKK